MLGLIGARGGSERLPGKNIKNFFGKPLIVWTIEAAKKSGIFERIIVVTDSTDIAAIAKHSGAEVPFMEPAELATNLSYHDALRYTLQKLADDEKYVPENFILLEPSAVGRTVSHIREVAELLTTRTDFDSIVGISEVPGHFSYSKQLVIASNGIVGRVGDNAPLKNLIHRNQEVPKSYVINSAIYGFRRKNLFEGDKSLWGESTYGYVMDGSKLADIDTIEDWVMAEAKMKHFLAGKEGKYINDRR
jgi:CMP-N-acetylneuraminic acid synthetase